MTPPGRWHAAFVTPGWRVVAFGIAMQFLHFGLFQQAFSVYLPVLVASMGWSAASLGVVFALHQAVAGAIGPLQGQALARWGSRRLATAGTLILCVALLGVATSTNLVGFALWFAVGAVGQYLAGFLTLTTSVVSWFGRGSVWPLTLLQTGLSLGGLFAPVVAWAVAHLGWRTTLGVSSGAILGFGLLLARGLVPGPYAPSPAAVRDGSVDRAYRRAVTSRAFWTIAAGHSLALAVVQGVNLYVVLFLTTRGVSLPAAAGVVAVSTSAMFFGQLSSGFLGTRLPGRWLTTGCMLMHTVALVMLSVGRVGAVMIPFALLHGFAWGVRGPIMQSIRVEYFGSVAFSRVMGMSIFVATVGAVIGPIAVGAIADSALGFEGALLGLASAAGLAAIAFGVSVPPSRGLDAIESDGSDPSSVDG